MNLPITLENRSRMLSPAITCGLCLLMFGPLIVVTLLDGPTGKMIGGAAILAFCILWCGISAVRAPYAVTIDDQRVKIRRLIGERSHAIGDVKNWFFSVPDDRPTRQPPQTNALLQMKLADRTRFRAEVTADEAAALAQILPATDGATKP